MVYVVEEGTHSAASQSSGESVDLLCRELMAIVEGRRSSVDFVETGVEMVRREFEVTYSRMCFVQLE